MSEQEWWNLAHTLVAEKYPDRPYAVRAVRVYKDALVVAFIDFLDEFCFESHPECNEEPTVYTDVFPIPADVRAASGASAPADQSR